MAFISLVFLAVMGVFGIFALMFIIGIVKHIKVLVAIPVAFLAILVLAIAVLVISVTVKRRGYTDVIDKWRNEGYFIHENTAALGAVRELLSDADAGDRESFAKIFMPKIQESEDFQSELDAFFENYPKGLSKCKLVGGFDSAGRGSERYCYAGFKCIMDGKQYRIKMKCVFYNKDKPEDIGVEYFYLESEEVYSQNNEYGNKILMNNTN